LDYKDNKYSNEAWQLRQKLDVLSEKPLKELKQINQGWKTQKYSNGGVDIYTDPNGNPYDNSGYYTQKTKFYSEWSDAFNSKWAANAKLNPIERDAKKYKEWETMHDSVLWFDTAACMAGPFIGDTNSVTMAPDSNSAQLKTDP